MKYIFLLFLTFSLFANHDKGSFSVELGGGMGYLNAINDINDKITTVDFGIIEYMPDVKPLKWNIHYNFSAGYSFNKKFRISLYANHVRLKTKITQSFDTATTIYTGTGTTLAKYFDFSTGFATTGIGPLATYYITDFKKNFVLSGSLGLLYYFSSSFYQDTSYSNSADDASSLSANLHTIEGSAATFGALAKVSLDYYINKNFAVGLNLGYNYIKAPSLKDVDGNAFNFTYLDGTDSSSPAPLAINPSNIFAGLSLKFDFSFGGSNNSNNTSFTENNETNIQENEQEEDNYETQEAVQETQVTTEEEPKLDISELNSLKKRVAKFYKRAKRKKYYKRKKLLGKIHTSIKNTEEDWDTLSAQEQNDYMEETNEKITETLRVR